MTLEDPTEEPPAVTRFQRSQTELALIRRMASLTTRLLQDLDLSSVLEAIVEVGVDLVDGESGAVSLRGDNGRFMRVANVNMADDIDGLEVIPGVGLHGQAISTGLPVVVDDYDAWDGAVDRLRGLGFRSSIAVPIRRDGETIGALSVHSHVASRRFGDAEAEVLALLAEYAAVAIRNATAYRKVSDEREKFLALVETMHDGLAVVENGIVTGWNRAAATLTGVTSADAVGHAPPLDLDAAHDGVEIVDGSGRHRWIQTVASTLPQGSGTVYLVRDITDQHDLDKAKDLFFATTSHELKTPLTVVKGLASTLRQHWERMSVEQRDDVLATIERRAETLNRLIERILVGSRVQAGAFFATPTPIELPPIIAEAVAGWGAASVAHHVVADVATDLPLVAGDRQALDTILGHLIENAIKYSPDGGQVRVQASFDHDADEAVVSVTDEGVGLDGELARLLQPFVQADNGATRRFGGVGLGLYIVSQLIDALGGRLWATNRDGGGAIFTFTVPAWH